MCILRFCFVYTQLFDCQLSPTQKGIFMNWISIFMFLKEVAEPLQDLKEGMDQLEKNKTLRYILTTLLAIGNFLNSTDVSNSKELNEVVSGFLFVHFLSLGVLYLLPLFPPTLLLLSCQHICLTRITVDSQCRQECACLTVCTTVSFYNKITCQGLC